MEQRIAVYGAGALGTALGAFLTQEGKDVTLVSRNRAHVAALAEQGAQITGAAELRQRVRAVTPEQMGGDYDLIVLLTKQLENGKTAAFLQQRLKPEGLLITGQNGIPEPLLAQVLGPERVAGCPVAWGAMLTGPGCCRLTAKPAQFGFGLGGLAGMPEEKLRWAQGLLGYACGAPLCGDILGLRWSKLIINAAFTGLGTCMGGTFGDVARDPKSRALALACVRECLAVCRAAGIRPAPVQGLDIEKLFGGEGRMARAAAMALLPVAMHRHRNTKPSMLQDLEKGKLSEIDAVNGLVCRWGAEQGVKTPVNEAIVATVHQLEAGELQPCRENLRRLAQRI